jgi:hypothetical protein
MQHCTINPKDIPKDLIISLFFNFYIHLAPRILIPNPEVAQVVFIILLSCNLFV